MPILNRRNLIRSTLTANLPAPAVATLGKISNKLRNIAQNANHWDMHRNGELYTIARACTRQNSCVIDVGANEGHWSEEVLRLLPSAELHCFEPIPETFIRARSRLAGIANVEITCAGLGAESGEETFEVRPESHELASKYEQDSQYTLNQTSPITVTIVRGDEYVSERELTVIDLLKIDVEGMELEVLRGFRNTLASGNIRVVQFEYGVGYIGARAYLRDVFLLLEGFGYRIHELRPAEWREVSYHFSLEDFNPRNFVAVLDKVV